MTTAADRLLVDTNVLVYASLRNSAWHANAIQAIHSELQAGGELWVSRQILREYLAVLTRPGTTTLSSPAATVAADIAAFEWMFHVADDTGDVTSKLLGLVQSVPMGGKQIHDANLVATMQAYGIPRPLTHNVADFTPFGALITVIPIASGPEPQRTVSIPKMKQSYRSARNELLKKIPRDHGQFEHWGMGVHRKIVDGMREYNGTEPDLIEEEDRFIVRLWKRRRMEE